MTGNGSASSQPSGPPAPLEPVTADTWLSLPPPAADAEALAEAVKYEIMHAAPAALVHILGRQCYEKGVSDVYDVLQSETFLVQTGYSILECILTSLCPEMKDSVRRMHAPEADC